MINNRTRPNQHPNFTARRGLVIGAALLTLFGVPKGAEFVANKIGGPEVPSLPNAKTPEGKAEIEREVEEGKLVTVKIDDANSTLYDLSDSLTDGDPGPLATALQKENGGSTEVHSDDVFAVPVSDAALALHKKQFPNEG